MKILPASIVPTICIYIYIYTHIYIVSFSNFRMSQPYPTMFDYPSYSHLIPFNQIPLNPATAWWITLVALLPRNSAAQRPVDIMASLSCCRKFHGDETWWSNQPYWTSILWWSHCQPSINHVYPVWTPCCAQHPKYKEKKREYLSK